MTSYFKVIEETAHGVVHRFIDANYIESYCIRDERLWIYMLSGDVIITTYDEDKARRYTPLEF